MPPGHDGHIFIALNIAAFIDLADFKRQIDNIVRQIHQSRLAPGVERIYAPGELEAQTEARYLADGIPLNETTLADLSATAKDLTIDPTRFLT